MTISEKKCDEESIAMDPDVELSWKNHLPIQVETTSLNKLMLISNHREIRKKSEDTIYIKWFSTTCTGLAVNDFKVTLTSFLRN